MIPRRLVAPIGPVVSLADIRRHLDADPNDTSQDLMFAAMETEAVSKLDGYRGILGRGILPQTWTEGFTGWGNLRLSLPDVSAARVTYTDADGITAPATTAVLHSDALGAYVTASGPSAVLVTVEYDIALPDECLPSVRAAVKLYVRHHYDARGEIDPKAAEYFERSFAAQIGHIRWVRT
jgi:hypothetical protein